MEGRRSLESLFEESTARKPRRIRGGTPPSSATRQPHPTPPSSATQPTPPLSTKTTLYRNPMLRGWGKSVDQNYIDDMLYRIGLEKEEEPTVSLSEASALNLPTQARKSRVRPGDGHKSGRVRRIEVPWRSHDPFASPSDLKQKAFKSFQMMCPEMPKTPPTNSVRGATHAPEVPTSTILAPKLMARSSAHRIVPPKRQIGDASTKSKKKSVKSSLNFRLSDLDLKPSGRGLVVGQQNVKSRGGQSRAKIEAEPQKTGMRVVHESEYFRPTSKPLPAPTVPRTATPGGLTHWRTSMHFQRTQNTTRMNTPYAHPEPRSTFARLEEERRREIMALTRPTRTRPGLGRDGIGKREVKPKVHLPNPNVIRAGKWTGTRTPPPGPADQSPSPSTKNQKLHVELQQLQRAQFQRRVHPAMMFPFHVPGPKQDNIFIGNYVGSDDEDEGGRSTEHHALPSPRP